MDGVLTPQLVKQLALMLLFLGMFVVLPIIFALLEHQRKMAALFRGKSEESQGVEKQLGEVVEELRALRAENAELRSALSPRSEIDTDLSSRLT